MQESLLITDDVLILTENCNVMQVVEELTSLAQIVWPIIVTSFLLYSKSVISMIFLGRLGEAELAGGSLSIAFANITGYSVLKGLAMGMEPICGQAYGAKRWAILSLTFQKTLLLLLLAAIPITFLWLYMEPILVHLGQDSYITSIAKNYIVFSLPDLFAQALLHPLRIFLRTQSLTGPLTLAATFALLLHVPINYVLVSYLGYGIKGVALASGLNTMIINVGLVLYLMYSSKALKPWSGLSLECLKGWSRLVALAAPSAASVCLEWWWYEVMLILCGLLGDPQASVAAMGVLIQTTGLIYVLPSSLSIGISIRVSHELGAHRPGRAQQATHVGVALAVAFGISAFVFADSVRGVWGKMFTGDLEILRLTEMALPIVGLCELGNCPQTAGCGVLRGSARPTVGANINFGSFYLIGLPVAAMAGFRFRLGFLGLWLGLVAAQASCACFMLYTVWRTDWKAQVERAKELTGDETGEKGDLEAGLLVS